MDNNLSVVTGGGPLDTEAGLHGAAAPVQSLVDPSQDYWTDELNGVLAVEHCQIEALTGRDVVSQHRECLEQSSHLGHAYQYLETEASSEASQAMSKSVPLQLERPRLLLRVVKTQPLLDKPAGPVIRGTCHGTASLASVTGASMDVLVPASSICSPRRPRPQPTPIVRLPTGQPLPPQIRLRRDTQNGQATTPLEPLSWHTIITRTPRRETQTAPAQSIRGTGLRPASADFTLSQAAEARRLREQRVMSRLKLLRTIQEGKTPKHAFRRPMRHSADHSAHEHDDVSRLSRDQEASRALTRASEHEPGVSQYEPTFDYISAIDFGTENSYSFKRLAPSDRPASRKSSSRPITPADEGGQRRPGSRGYDVRPRCDLCRDTPPQGGLARCHKCQMSLCGSCWMREAHHMRPTWRANPELAEAIAGRRTPSKHKRSRGRQGCSPNRNKDKSEMAHDHFPSSLSPRTRKHQAGKHSEDPPMAGTASPTRTASAVSLAVRRGLATPARGRARRKASASCEDGGTADDDGPADEDRVHLDLLLQGLRRMARPSRRGKRKKSRTSPGAEVLSHSLNYGVLRSVAHSMCAWRPLLGAEDCHDLLHRDSKAMGEVLGGGTSYRRHNTTVVKGHYIHTTC